MNVKSKTGIKRLLAFLFLLLCASQSRCGQQEYVLLDFEDSVLHDDAWALSQPLGTPVILVRPKTDSGPDNLLLAPGQGRNGGNALLVESTNASMGLPGFFVIKGRTAHGWIENPNDSERYMLPRGRRANRMEYWIRFEQGYRFTNASAQPPAWPNHQNMHFGTYHYDPVVPGTGHESYNWHFYHQIFLRHDQAGTNWIHVVLNEQPQHQRSLSSMPPYNPTRPKGNYWELLTRFYMDGHTYFSDPEISYPVRMWVDDIKLSYEPTPSDVQVGIEDYVPGQRVIMAHAVTNDLQISLRNKRACPVTGRLVPTVPYWLNPELLEADGSAAPSILTLEPGATSNFTMRLVLNSSLATNRMDMAGFMFIPTNQYVSGTTFTDRSFSDPNVEKRWFPEQGPHDATVYSTHIRVVVNTPSGNDEPTILGGRCFWTLQDRVYTNTLTSSDPDNDPLSYIITSQDGTGVVLNSQSGVFTFSPSNGFTGVYSFRCMDQSGAANSNDAAFWIHVVADSDHDGLPDDWEIANLGSLSHDDTADPDSDGYSNLREFTAGTHPNQSTSHWSACISSTNQMAALSITAPVAAGSGYVGCTRYVGLYATRTLVNPVWIPQTGYEKITASGQRLSAIATNNDHAAFFMFKSWLE